jgi:branched-chain amino acid transport system substrate-binding protein
VNWPQTVENQQFVKKFFQRTGRYPSYAAAGAYAGIHAIAAVVSNTKSLANNGALISRFQALSIKLPEDPDGFESHMNPVTHQIQQVQAIGITVRNTSFPPATVLLDHWFVYSPD